MKSFFFLIATLLLFKAVDGQLKTEVKCPDIKVDVLNGIVNGAITPNSNVAQIKKYLFCFSSFVDSVKAKCGSTVFYNDKNIYFYASRNYIEIGPHFKGTLSVPLLGASRNNLFKILGAPQIKQTGWEAFKTAYGIIILYYNGQEKVNKIQISTRDASTIQLCN